MAALFFLVGLVILGVVNAVAHAAARFGMARALGVPGVRFFSSKLETRGASTAFAPRAAVSAAGLVANYTVAVVVGFLAFTVNGEPYVDTASMKVVVSPDGPAADAGMQTGDRVIAVDGNAVGDWDALRSAVSRARGAIDVEYTREGAPAHARVTPRGGRIAVTPPAEARSMSVGGALGKAVAMPFQVIAYALKGFIDMFTVHEHVDVTGPLGVAKSVGSEPRALAMLAMLSAYYLPFFLLVALIALPRKRGNPRPTG